MMSPIVVVIMLPRHLALADLVQPVHLQAD